MQTGGREEAARDETLEETSIRAAEPESKLEAGAVVDGRYRITHAIGRGGMGEVFAAVDACEGDRPCALKVLREALAARPAAVARFEREARLLAAVSSEHVVRLLGFGRAVSGAPYLVLERLEGEDLRQILDRRGPLPVGEALRHAHQAALGLREAHRAGLVHRDIKPSNLFVTRPHGGVDGVVKLVDFGIARQLAPEDTSLTSTGEALGSPRYMSPEQVRNAKDIDPRTDLWSLGVTLYELLTGALPFEGSTASAVSAAIVADSPIPPRARVPTLPAEVERVVLACLEKDPAARYESAAELAAELAAAATALGTTPHGTKPPRSRALVLVGGVTAIASLAALAWSLRGSPEVASAPRTDEPREAAMERPTKGAEAPADPTPLEAESTALPKSTSPLAAPTASSTHKPEARSTSTPTATARPKSSALVAGPLDDRK